jgi:hypothetical protein
MKRQLKQQRLPRLPTARVDTPAYCLSLSFVVLLFRKIKSALGTRLANRKFSEGFRYGQHVRKVLNGGFESRCDMNGYELKHNNLESSNGHSRNVN